MEEFLRNEFGYDGLDERTLKRIERTKRRENLDCDDNIMKNQQSEQHQASSSLSMNYSTDDSYHEKDGDIGNDNDNNNNIDVDHGHVFVVNGSVCDLSCDAFLCPVAIPNVRKKKNRNQLIGRIFTQWRNQQINNYPQFWDYMLQKQQQQEQEQQKQNDGDNDEIEAGVFPLRRYGTTTTKMIIPKRLRRFEIGRGMHFVMVYFLHLFHCWLQDMYSSITIHPVHHHKNSMLNFLWIPYVMY